MSTSAAFFINKGSRAEFVLGHSFDGYPQDGSGHGVPKEIMLAKSEAEFRKLVSEYEKTLVSEYIADIEGLGWKDALGYSYIYTFFNGHVWITQGGRWFNNFIKEKPPTSLPPAPITRKGEISGEICITCGECLYRKTISSKQLLSWSRRQPTSLIGSSLITSYFESKGFRFKRQQGWVCKECK